MNIHEAWDRLEAAGCTVTIDGSDLVYNFDYVPGNARRISFRATGYVDPADVDAALEAVKQFEIAEKLHDLNQNRPLR